MGKPSCKYTSSTAITFEPPSGRYSLLATDHQRQALLRTHESRHPDREMAGFTEDLGDLCMHGQCARALIYFSILRRPATTTQPGLIYPIIRPAVVLFTASTPVTKCFPGRFQDVGVWRRTKGWHQGARHTNKQHRAAPCCSGGCLTVCGRRDWWKLLHAVHRDPSIQLPKRAALRHDA
ncbi:hypothetical protein RRG08_045521 [Elysia crispata]|uniref:Uncharacterized protein n=1 Tax=Elysia crispata TaxID=231223 RepID=A0AAE1CWS1_9GAST|nr:hypothetical protein RRG08_045521 [Elysia crispata]